MEIVVALLMFVPLALMVLLVLGVVQGHGRSKLEDDAQYEELNRPE